MARTGRPAKPDAAKRIEGTFRPDRERKGIATSSAPLPPPPSWLSERAETEWERMVPIMSEAGLLTGLDVAVMAGYCEAYAQFVEATAGMNSRPRNGNASRIKLVQRTNAGVRPNPLVKIRQDALVQMRNYMGELGLTPAARQKIRAEPQEEENALDKLLSEAEPN